jgi:hypothetical protein
VHVFVDVADDIVDSDPACRAFRVPLTRRWVRRAKALLLRHRVVEVTLTGRRRKKRRVARWCWSVECWRGRDLTINTRWGERGGRGEINNDYDD